MNQGEQQPSNQAERAFRETLTEQGIDAGHHDELVAQLTDDLFATAERLFFLQVPQKHLDSGPVV